MDDFTPANGGSLRTAPPPAAPDLVATFTRASTPHPDDIWNPRSREIAPPGRPLPGHSRRPWLDLPEHPQEDGHAEQTPHEAVAGQVRAALRPGG